MLDTIVHANALPLNTLRPRQMANISQTTISDVFFWMKIYEFCLIFHWSVFLRVKLASQHWLRWWLCTDQATNHYLNQWWLIYCRIYESHALNELNVQCHPQRHRGFRYDIKVSMAIKKFNAFGLMQECSDTSLTIIPHGTLSVRIMNIILHVTLNSLLSLFIESRWW